LTIGTSLNSSRKVATNRLKRLGALATLDSAPIVIAVI
jgi:hypothetical protein